MGKTIELSIGQFEPVIVDVMQASQADEFTFLFTDLPGVITSPVMHLRSPFGLAQTVSCTAVEDVAGAVFRPATATFLEPGMHSASLQVADSGSDTVYSFPILFRCVRNPAISEWRYKVASQLIGGEYSIDVQPVLNGGAIEGKVFVAFGDGRYVIDSQTGAEITARDEASKTVTYDVTISLSGGYVVIYNALQDVTVRIPNTELFAYTDAYTQKAPTDVPPLWDYRTADELLGELAPGEARELDFAATPFSGEYGGISVYRGSLTDSNGRILLTTLFAELNEANGYTATFAGGKIEFADGKVVLTNTGSSSMSWGTGMKWTAVCYTKEGLS